jgi:uncharacterized UPF0160 family protein
MSYLVKKRLRELEIDNGRSQSTSISPFREFERLVEEYVTREIDDIIALYNTPEATAEPFESDDPNNCPS